MVLGVPGAPAARAQDGPAAAAEREPLADVLSRVAAAFGAGDYAGAEAALRAALELDAGNFVHHYNLASALAMQGKTDEAVASLRESVQRGFVNFTHLRGDPNLAPLHDHPGYRALVDNASLILDAHLEANLRLTEKFFGKGLDVVRDDRMRIAYASAFDPLSFAAAREELSRLHEWSLAEVFADLADTSRAADDAWVVVVLPDQRGFRRWAVGEYGAEAITGLAGIGGAYDHDAKRLVAQDLGGTLRHEFFHVLHWRSCTRLGQAHPVWIQEGLCSLVEDYRLEADGSITLLPSWRTNTVKRLLAAGKLPRIEQLVAMPRERFTGVRPLANYAMARTLLLYVWARGRLRDWYAAYTADYAEDPTGLAALKRVLGEDLEQVERDYREWVRALPEVAEQVRPGAASLGADVEPGEGDGPVIVAMERDSPARRAGLRPRDVITAIDGKPTRDLNELVRVLGEYEAGDTVAVSYRRFKRHGTATVRLTTR